MVIQLVTNEFFKRMSQVGSHSIVIQLLLAENLRF